MQFAKSVWRPVPTRNNVLSDIPPRPVAARAIGLVTASRTPLFPRIFRVHPFLSSASPLFFFIFYFFFFFFFLSFLPHRGP